MSTFFSITVSALVLLLVSTPAIGAPSRWTSRQGPNLNCDISGGGLANPMGTLRMYSTFQAQRYGSHLLPSEGIQLGYGPDPFLESANSDSLNTNFRFQLCNSTYLGYTQGEGESGATDAPGNIFYYGLVIPLESNNDLSFQCLSATVNSSLPTLIHAPACSYTDDASQLSQFWSLSYNVNDGVVNTTSALLTFLGRTRDTKVGYYSTVYANGSYGDINAQVRYEGGLNFATEYEIDLIPSS